MARPVHGDPKFDANCDKLCDVIEATAANKRFWNNISHLRARRLLKACIVLRAAADATVDMLTQKKYGGTKGAIKALNNKAVSR